LKVAFDHQIFSAQRYGGISRYFFELASRMPADVTAAVIAPAHINHYLSRPEARRFVHGRYVPFTFRGQVRLVNAVNGLAAPALWRRLRPDIAHETYFSKDPIGCASRRVVTIYDMIYELFRAEFAGGEAVIAAKRAAIARADHLICISEATRRDLMSFYSVESERTSVVHLGHLSPRLPTPGKEAGPAAGRPFILYVGNRGGYKNFARLVTAYSSSALLRSELDLVAFGGAPFSAEEAAQLERLGISGTVSQESGADSALLDRYANATVFVCPSLYEGFGIPVLEAMAVGCPVISSDRGSLPEVVGDAGLYVDPENVDDMRAALERVVTNASLRRDLRERGTERAKQFSWDRCADETARIYRTIVQ
jgi:glycosyltransferase involved in cell wall biosynthesis